MHIVPKVLIHVATDFNLYWTCPGCGELNTIWMPECFSVEDVKREVAKMELEQVQCPECCRKFERADL